MTEATQPGADVSTPAIDGSEVSGAAQLIEGLLSREEGGETPAQEEKTASVPQTEQQTDATDGATQADSGEDAESVASEKKSPEGATDEIKLESLDELAEATGLPLETILNLKASTKVDGQDQVIPLAEIVKSYQLESHFTKKSMELAEQRKAFEAEREKGLGEIQNRVVQAATLIQTLEKNLIGDYERVDWNKLRTENPAEYAALSQDFAARNNQVQQMKQTALQEVQRLNQENQQKFQAERQKLISQERERLLEVIPEWRDPAKMKAEHAELWDYLRGMGYADEQINNVIDHRDLVTARKAMLYDKMKKGAAVTAKKVVSLPPVLKPGSTKGKVDKAREKIQANMQRARKTGKVHDAAAAIEAMIKD